jgi:hypothetical protein
VTEVTKVIPEKLFFFDKTSNMKNFTISKEEAEVLQMGLREAWELASKQCYRNNGQRRYGEGNELAPGYVNKAEEVKRIADELGERLKTLFSPEPLNIISKSQDIDAAIDNYLEWEESGFSDDPKYDLSKMLW